MKWSMTEGQNWISFDDVDGNRHLIPVAEIVHVYDYTTNRQPAFSNGQERRTAIRLRGVSAHILTNVSVQELTRMLAGDRSSKE